MGGGGSYYDRDTSGYSYDSNSGSYDRDTSSSVRKTSQGYTRKAEKAFERSRINKATLPKDRSLTTQAEDVVVWAFDVTGSMGDFPRTLWDKLPMIAGQLKELGYLRDPEISLAAVGDAVSDSAPIQICDFVKAKDLDASMKKLWLEGMGGGQEVESYELTAYYYANKVELPKAEMPIFIFIGDEGFRTELDSRTLNNHFGGRQEGVSAQAVFAKLKEKFKGNVFLIHKQYSSGGGYADKAIVNQWQDALGSEKVIILGENMAIGDIILGIFALVSSKRTLTEYLADMVKREQTPARVASVKASLTDLADYLKKNRPANKSVKVEKNQQNLSAGKNGGDDKPSKKGRLM